jgi:hypothetical protein
MTLVVHDREISDVCVVFNIATGKYIVFNFLDIIHYPNFYLQTVF